MKRLPLVVTAVIVLALSIMGCQPPQPKPYTPRYTADQVIRIAQAQYPVGFKREMIGQDASGMFRYQTVNTPTSVSVQYLGGSRAAWKVTISLPFGYFHQDYSFGTKTLYFYETDGSLQGTYYP